MALEGKNWKICKIDNHCNEGIVATCDIKAGEIIIEEKPLWFNRREANYNGHKQLFKTMKTKYPQWLNKLHYSDSDYKYYLSSAANDKKFAKFLAQCIANSFDIGRGGCDWSVLYLQTSKFNHSCLPNATRTSSTPAVSSDNHDEKKETSINGNDAHNIFGKNVVRKTDHLNSLKMNTDSYVGKTCAIRDIKKGEQITISYLSHASHFCLPTNQRNSLIQKDFCFICQCVRCNPRHSSKSSKKNKNNKNVDNAKMKIDHDHHFAMSIEKLLKGAVIHDGNKHVISQMKKDFDKLFDSSSQQLYMIQMIELGETFLEKYDRYDCDPIRSKDKKYCNNILMSCHWRILKVRWQLAKIYFEILQMLQNNDDRLNTNSTNNSKDDRIKSIAAWIEKFIKNSVAILFAQNMLNKNGKNGEIYFQIYNDKMNECYMYLTTYFRIAVTVLNELSVKEMITFGNQYYRWLIQIRQLLSDHFEIYKKSFLWATGGITTEELILGIYWSQEDFREKYQKLIGLQSKN